MQLRKKDKNNTIKIHFIQNITYKWVGSRIAVKSVDYETM